MLNYIAFTLVILHYNHIMSIMAYNNDHSYHYTYTYIIINHHIMSSLYSLYHITFTHYIILHIIVIIMYVV